VAADVGLPAATGELTYNGYTFGSTMLVRNVSAVPVYNDNTTEVKYVRYSLTVEDVLAVTDAEAESDSRGTGVLLNNAYSRLLDPGKPLYYVDKGFRDFTINTGSDAFDVVYGPLPQMLEYQPIGNNRACRIVWQIVVHLARCLNSADEGLAAFGYGVTWALDTEGMTTRTINGYLEIAGSRNGDGIFESADSYRERILISSLPGFRRSQTYSLSADYRKLTWTITDTEIPSPFGFPTNVVDMQATHTISSSTRGAAFQNWNCTLSGTVKTPFNLPKSIAWTAIQSVLGDRIRRVGENALTQTQNEDDGEKPKKSQYLITSVSISEDIYSFVTRFSVGYTIYGAKLEEIFVKSGLWRRPPGSFSEWQATMSDVFGARGFANLFHDESDVIIIDLCGNQDIPPIEMFSTKTEPSDFLVAFPLNKCPEPESSWMEYSLELNIKSDNGTIVHRVLEQDDLPKTSENVPDGFDPGQEAGLFFDGTQPSMYVQQTGGPKYEVFITGHAVRVGHKIPLPRIKKIAGREVTETTQDVSQKIIENKGCAIYAAKWTIGYVIDKPPDQLIEFPYDPAANKGKLEEDGE